MWGGWGRGTKSFWDSELGLVGFGGGFLGFRVGCWGPRLMVLALYGFGVVWFEGLRWLVLLI